MVQTFSIRSFIQSFIAANIRHSKTAFLRGSQCTCSITDTKIHFLLYYIAYIFMSESQIPIGQFTITCQPICLLWTSRYTGMSHAVQNRARKWLSHRALCSSWALCWAQGHGSNTHGATLQVSQCARMRALSRRFCAGTSSMVAICQANWCWSRQHFGQTSSLDSTSGTSSSTSSTSGS